MGIKRWLSDPNDLLTEKRWFLIAIVFTWLFSISLLLMFSGCETFMTADGKEAIRINPVASEKVENTAEATISLLTLLVPLLGPGAAVAAGGVATGLGVWRKMKPKLVVAQTKHEMSHSAASALVDGIEEFKKANPEEFAKLRDKLIGATKESGMDTKMLDNFIRGLRGRPPKA